MPGGFLFSHIIAITGHRNYTGVSEFYRGLDMTRANQYYFGGARGIDSDALQYIARTQPTSMRTVVVPNRLIDQPAITRAVTRQNATQIIELKNTGLDRFQLRNQYMVDKSTSVRAFYDGRQSGGTYNTIQYARSQGKPVLIWDTKAIEMDEYMRQTEKEFGLRMGSLRDARMNLSPAKIIILAFYKQKYPVLPQYVADELHAWHHEFG